VTELSEYRFGHVTVDGAEETRDLIVLPRRVVRDWWRRESHRLALADLEAVIDELPGRLLVGTGAYGRLRVDRAVVEELGRRGVTVEAHPTADAVSRYGELGGRGTAAALHLTC
jgi:hypothetical protein